MEVINRIKIHSINGEILTVGDDRELLITNVWNKPTMIGILTSDGNKIELWADDLLKAIKNSTNNT